MFLDVAEINIEVFLMITIPGDYLEGGGSVVRLAVALSAVTGKQINITNIRAGRCNPGLRAQHVEVVKSMAALCDASVSNIEVGSQELTFEPGKIKGGSIHVNIPTAGSIGLLLQSMMVASIHAKEPVELTIKGGAVSGKWAAPVNYMKYVLLPILEKMGYRADIEIKKYGYYPKGGGQVTARLYPSKLSPLVLKNQGKIISIHGISHASYDLKKSQVAERQRQSAEVVLKEYNPEVDIQYVSSDSPGSAVELWAVFDRTVLGGDALGERGKRSEAVGEEAASKLLQQVRSGATVDEHAEDQLIVYMALAADKGVSEITVPKLTGHTKTNIWLVEKFLPVKFEIKEKVIKCTKIQ